MIKIRYILLFTLFCSMLVTFYFLPTNAYASAEWEVYAMLGGEIEAYFLHPEWNMVHNVFWRDIRAKAPGMTTEWSFEVDSSLNDYNFTIRWDLSRVPESYTIF